MLKNLIKNTILLLPLIALTSCATVFTGSNQSVNIKVVDFDSLEAINQPYCFIIDNNGSQYPLNSNPGSIVVSKGHGPLRFTCKKEGYHQVDIAEAQDINFVTFANVLFWPGFIIDGVSGAYSKYPANVIVRMQKNLK